MRDPSPASTAGVVGGDGGAHYSTAASTVNLRSSRPSVNQSNNSDTIAGQTAKQAHDDDGLSNLSDFGEDTSARSTTGHFMTLMNMIKANLGTGILAMGYAFKNSGLTLGVLGIVLFAVICTHCMQMILGASHYFSRKLGRERFSYTTVVRMSFQHSPLHRWANAVTNLTLVFIFLTQLGFCCIYIVFVARTVDNVLEEYNAPQINIRLLEVMWAPLFLLLVLIRNLKRLSPLSMAANIITLVALIVAYQEQIRHLQPMATITQFGRASNLPRFFGTAIYAFEGISCVLPVENKMTRPKTFGGLFGILNQAMFITAVMYAVTGFLGYWAYGDGVQGSITYNLPKEALYTVAKLAMACAVYISYAIQLYVPIRIMLPYVRRRFAHHWVGRHLVATEYIMRVTLMLVTLAFALFLPHLSEFIGLIGAFGSSYLALILPPVIDLVYRYSMDRSLMQKENGKEFLPYGKFNYIIVKNIILIILAIVGFALGTYLAVSDIVEQFRLDALGNNTST